MGGAVRRAGFTASAGLFLLAVGVRLLHIHLIRDNPYFDHPPVDAGYYDRWARALADGQPFGQGAFYQAPFYPYLLAIIYKVAGHAPAIARIVQAVIDSFGVLLVAGIARRVATPRAGWIAGVVAALYAPLVFYQGMLLEATVAIFLSLAMLRVLAGASGPPSTLRSLGAGLLLGLACITSPTNLFLLPAVMIWLGWTGRGTGRLLQAVRIGAFALATCAAIAPVTIRNLTDPVAPDLIFISCNTGQNFFTGNNVGNETGSYHSFEGVGSDPLSEEAAFGEQALRETGQRAMSPAAVSWFYIGKGLRFFRTYPGKAALLQIKKALLLVNRAEMPDSQNYYFFQRFAPLLRAPLPGFGAVAPFGLAGLLLLWRRNPGTLLLAMYIIAYGLSVIVFYVVARNRLPLAPVLIVFGAAALDELITSWREGGAGAGARWIVAIIGAGVLVNVPLPFARIPMAPAHAYLGQVYADQGMTDLAKAEFLEALKENPDHIGALAALGRIYIEQGEHPEAIEVYRRWTELRPDRAAPIHLLGVAYEGAGEDRVALQQYLRAVEVDEGYLPAILDAAILLDRLDQLDHALLLMDEALRTYPGFAEGYFTLGTILEGRRRYPDAIAQYRLAQQNGFADPLSFHLRMAYCHAAMGDTQTALENVMALERGGFRPDKDELRKIYELVNQHGGGK